MQIEDIPLARLDLASPGWDAYIFTFPVEPGPVQDAIAAVGLQQPIVVAPRGRKFQLVIGVRRALACRALGWQEIPAIVRREATPEQLLWLSLQEKIGGRPLNPVEKSRALQRFAELWQGDFERLQQEICPLLDLPPTPEAVENYLFMKEYPEACQQHLAEGRLTPQHTALLRSLPPQDRRVAAEKLFDRPRLPLQAAREILANATGLAARRGVPVAEVFEQPEVREIFVREHLTPQQRTAHLRTWLYQQRYPERSAREVEFEALAQQLAAGTGLTIRPPRELQGDEVTVSFRAQQPAEVKQVIAAMHAAESQGLWQKLFALVRGGAGSEQEQDDF